MTQPAINQGYSIAHYAYCQERDCTGCLPTDDALQEMNLMALWGEMANRCISQTPDTKTIEGAVQAIVADGDYYRERAAEVRQVRVEADYWGPWPMPVMRPPVSSICSDCEAGF